MYKFREITPRVADYRYQIRNRVLTYDSERGEIITEAYKRLGAMIPILKKAYAQHDWAEKCTCYIGDTELIVGGKGKYMFSSSGFPESGEFAGSTNEHWIIGMVKAGLWKMGDDGFYHSPDTALAPARIHPDTIKKMDEMKEFWKYKENTSDRVTASLPDFYAELAGTASTSYLMPGQPGFIPPYSLPLGHLVAGYKKIINTGYKAIYDQATAWLDAHYGKLFGDDARKYSFYKAIQITADAAMIFVKRYGDACKAKAAECTDEKRKAELERMAEDLYWISEKPAKTFRQALQAYMSYQVFHLAETSNPSAALGRFDQNTWPFLKKDLEDGVITIEEAQELVDMFFLKANCFYGIAPEVVADTTGVGNTWQHTTIGGVDPLTGEDATNPVTYMVLETVARLELHDPTISLRFNKNTPDELWSCAVETSKMVGGLPLYQNDEVIIPGLIKEVGFSLEDARDYGIIGCQEIVGCGNDFPAPNGCPPHGSAFWSIIFDMAINNGINPLNGYQCSVHTGYLYEMENIEQVRDAVRKMGYHIQQMFASMHCYAEEIALKDNCQPALSMSVEGCMEKGLDVSWGGAKYNSFGCTATGLSTVADSLNTIKYMCFDKKLCTTRELYDAVMANWEGYEDLREQVKAVVPHYGNGDPYADVEGKWINDLYYEICQTVHSTRSKVYKSGLYGASDHIRQGRITWATPDGRKLGDPIADGSSPVQGFDKNGPTAVFTSCACYDHHHYMDGIALNLRLHPSVVSNDEGIAKVVAMTKAYFANGGMETQYNVVDTATLRKAQEDPSAYKDLVVRIAGYSAYFVDMSKDLQNDIIARTENQLG
ncbi:MAG: hypothetical protein IKG08_09045 [Eubacterium sp.]|nr:hypothetical protein [Eubacterium sp.]